MNALRFWMALACGLACLLSARLAAAEAAGDGPLYLALFVGNNAYHRQSDQDPDLKPLEHTDLDVVRMWELVRHRVAREDALIFVDPDPLIAARLARRGIPAVQGFEDGDPVVTGAYMPPTVAAVTAGFEALRDRIDAEPADREVVVLVYISSHGDRVGMHLLDAMWPASEFQFYLGQLRATEITFIADACYAHDWIQLKGTGDPNITTSTLLAEDLVSMQTLKTVGRVAADTALPEGGPSTGGLLTSWLLSCFRGACDNNLDASPSWPETRFFLEQQQARYGESTNVTVSPPERPGSHPVFRNLWDDKSAGLKVTRESWALTGQYWQILDEDETLVAEFLRRPGEPKLIHLEPGVYRLNIFYEGLVGDVLSFLGGTTLVEVAQQEITQLSTGMLGLTPIAMPGQKGIADGRRPREIPPDLHARATTMRKSLSELRRPSPVFTVAADASLPGQWAASLQGDPTPIDPAIDPSWALVQEVPHTGLAFSFDPLALDLGSSGLTLNLGLGASLRRSVAPTLSVDGQWAPVTYGTLQGRAALQWGSPNTRAWLRLSAGGWGMPSGDPTQTLLLGHGIAGLEVGMARRIFDPLWLMGGIGPEVILESYRSREDAYPPTTHAYPGMRVWVGVGF